MRSQNCRLTATAESTARHLILSYLITCPYAYEMIEAWIEAVLVLEYRMVRAQTTFSYARAHAVA
jgi:hypothetical protein